LPAMAAMFSRFAMMRHSISIGFRSALLSRRDGPRMHLFVSYVRDEDQLTPGICRIGLQVGTSMNISVKCHETRNK
jgi:hypothetical protein